MPKRLDNTQVSIVSSTVKNHQLYSVDDLHPGFSLRLNALLDILEVDVPPITQGRKMWIGRVFDVAPNNATLWLTNDVVPKGARLRSLSDFCFLHLPKKQRPKKSIAIESWLLYGYINWKPDLTTES